MTLDPSLFKKYDIRGRAQGDGAPLTPEAVRAIGKAFGQYAREAEGKSLVVVGRDNRETSPALMSAVVAGLHAGGCQVVHLGLVPTPLVYWYAVQQDAAGVMVTGSHLPPEQNGLKLSIGARTLYGDQLQALRAAVDEAIDFIEPTVSTLVINYSAIQRYIDALTPRASVQRGLHVVIDAGSGMGGLVAPKLFEAWGHRVTCLYCEPDGAFPHHQPDPQVAANMRALADKVREVGADVGIGFDGDADRMGAVDERGSLLAGDRILALLARDVLARHPGAAVVGDVLSSQVLFDEIARCGGQPVLWASGHSLVKAKMVEVGALLGGEMSGHIFMAEDYPGFDDAFLAAGRLLYLVSASGEPLSALDASLPRLFSTPEYRPHCPDERKKAVIDGVKAVLGARDDVREIISVDGVRVRFERGWGLLRASNTEPVLSLRFEADSDAEALRLRDIFVTALRAYPEVGQIA